MSEVIELLVQYSKTSDSSYGVSVRKACVTDIARPLILCEVIWSVAGSDYRRYVCVSKLVHVFSEAPSLIENLNDEAVSENSSATSSALGTTNLDSRVIWSADEHDVLM